MILCTLYSDRCQHLQKRGIRSSVVVRAALVRIDALRSPPRAAVRDLCVVRLQRHRPASANKTRASPVGVGRGDVILLAALSRLI